MLKSIRSIGLWARSISGWAVILALALSSFTSAYAAIKGLPGPVIVVVGVWTLAGLLTIVVAALALRNYIGLHRYHRKPDYKKWDVVPWLADWQAACLWDDIEPYSPVADRTPAYPTLQMLKSAALDNLLGLSKSYAREDWERYSREALRNFARSRDIRPFAFFPEVRVGNEIKVEKLTPVISDNAPPVEIQPSSLDKFLYVGRIETSALKLLSDYRVGFDIIAFNGSAFSLVFGNVKGTIRYRLDGQSSYKELSFIQFLKLHWTDPVKPYSEFVIELVQPVNGIIANEISDAFARGGKVEFELLELYVTVQSADDAKVMGKIPVWPGISCTKFGERIVTNKIVYATITIKSGSDTTLS